MTAADLLTVGHADDWFRAILARVEALSAAAPAAGSAAVVLYSISDLAAVCRVDAGTVRRWLKVGKEDREGKRIYLRGPARKIPPNAPAQISSPAGNTQGAEVVKHDLVPPRALGDGSEYEGRIRANA